MSCRTIALFCIKLLFLHLNFSLQSDPWDINFDRVRRSQKHHRKSSGSKELKIMMCSGHDYISGAGGGGGGGGLMFDGQEFG